MKIIDRHAMQLANQAFELFSPDDAEWSNYTERINEMAYYIRESFNDVLEVAAQLADDINSGKYTTTKTAGEAIRAMKVK